MPELVKKQKIYIEISVKCNKPLTQITGIENDTLFLDVSEKPENNKANTEIIKFFTKTCRCLLKDVEYQSLSVKIRKGQKETKKTIEIEVSLNDLIQNILKHSCFVQK